MFYAIRDYTVFSQPQPPAGLRPIASLRGEFTPPVISHLHESLHAWSELGLSPGAMTPDRIWCNAEGALAFAFERNAAPLPLSHVGMAQELAAWMRHGASADTRGYGGYVAAGACVGAGCGWAAGRRLLVAAGNRGAAGAAPSKGWRPRASGGRRSRGAASAAVSRQLPGTHSSSRDPPIVAKKRHVEGTFATVSFLLASPTLRDGARTKVLSGRQKVPRSIREVFWRVLNELATS